jgi:Flp pilus assembly protein TadB
MNRTAPITLAVVAAFGLGVLAFYGQPLVGTPGGIVAGFAMIAVFLVLFYALMSEHARNKQKAGEQVRF